MGKIKKDKVIKKKAEMKAEMMGTDVKPSKKKEDGKSFVEDMGGEFAEIFSAGWHTLIDIGAWLIRSWDNLADLVEWFLKKSAVLTMRNLHDFRLLLARYRKPIMKHALLALVAGIGVVSLFAYVIDYQYSYNGRALGIVKEQDDVLEIMEMISDELSEEYGSTVAIDPDTDITFEPVVSYGKKIDDADDVLKRFTYMGDIQVTGSAIKINDAFFVAVENERVAEKVLSRVEENYLEGDREDYESVKIMDQITVEPYTTTLSNIYSESAAAKKIVKGKQEEITYTVQKDADLDTILDDTGMTLEELKENNKITKKTKFKEGDILVMQPAIPVVTVETREIKSFAEKVKYETVYVDSDQYYETEEFVKQQGKDGRAKVTAIIIKENGKETGRENLDREIIEEPVDKIVVRGTKKVPPKKGSGILGRPCECAVYRGYGPRWGRMHFGQDYSCPSGTPIHASDGGTVILAKWNGAYGNCIKIDHGGNVVTLYGHCSAIYVSEGETVFKGQTIGAVGSTGRSTGPHCHFEVFINGSNVDPASVLN